MKNLHVLQKMDANKWLYETTEAVGNIIIRLNMVAHLLTRPSSQANFSCKLF